MPCARELKAEKGKGRKEARSLAGSGDRLGSFWAFFSPKFPN